MNLGQVSELGKGCGRTQWNVDHTVVGQGGEDADDGGFASSTGTGGNEDTGWLVVELALLPEATRGVDEGLHLGWQITESGWEAEYDTVGGLKDVWGGDRVVWLGWGVQHAQDLVVKRLWDLVDGGGAAGGLNTLLDLLRKGCHVVVHGVNNDRDVGSHVASTMVCVLAWLLGWFR